MPENVAYNKVICQEYCLEESVENVESLSQKSEILSFEENLFKKKL